MIAQRQPYVVFGIGLFLWGITGYLYSLPTLGIAIVCLLIFLGITFSKRRPRFLTLMDVWIVAFVYLYGSEYILERDTLLSKFGSTIMSSVEGYVVAAFGASLFGYALFLRFALVKFAKEGKSTVFRGDHQKIPFKMVVGLVIMLAVSIIYIFLIMTPHQLLYVSRPQQAYYASDTILRLFLHAPMIMLPVFSAYLIYRYRVPFVLKLIVLFASFIAVTAIFLHGTRFYLIVVTSGVLYYFLDVYYMGRRRRLIIILLCSLLLMVGQGVMRSFRTVSAAEVLFSELMTDTRGTLKTILSAEALLRMNAWIFLSEYYRDPWRPMETLHLVYFWVPRTFWPQKPEQAGFWMVREVSGERGYNERHSVGAGYSMSALLDFGPIGGAICCVVYGLLIATFEALVARYRNPDSPGSMAAAIFYPSVFYMLRSLYAGLTFLLIANVAIIIPLVLLDRIANRKRTKIAIRPYASREVRSTGSVSPMHSPSRSHIRG